MTTSLLGWLNTAPGDRLLVVDNLENPDDVQGLLPSGAGMRVLFTSTQHTRTLGTPVEVGVYSVEQATQYLLDATQLDDPDGAALVAEDLGRLPVAITQAGVTTNLLGLTFTQYRELLTEHPLDESLTRDDDPYPELAGAALRLAYNTVVDHLAEQDPDLGAAAAFQLVALSMLAEAGVPRAWLSVLAASPAVGQKAIGLLIRNSLISLSADGTMVGLHRLQARVIREDTHQLDAGQDAIAAAVTVLTNVDLKPATGDYWTQRDRVGLLRDQLLAIDSQPQSHPLIPDLLGIAGQVCRLSNKLGDPYTGIALAPYIGHHNRELGPEHPNTLVYWSDVAAALLKAGDLDGAIKVLELTLGGLTRVLPADHSITLACRSQLAAAYLEARDFERAVHLSQQSLEETERVFGAGHQNVEIARNNLAIALQESGDVDQAISILTQVVADRELIDPHGPETISSRNNLAGVLRKSGDLVSAIELHEQSITDAEQLLGIDHPTTLTLRNNLAMALQEWGEFDRAISLFSQTLADRVRVLKPDHPDTLASRNNLAGAYQQAGDLDRAIRLFIEAFARMCHVLGIDHPTTATCRKNLVSAWCKRHESSADDGVLHALIAEAIRADPR